MSEHTSEVVLDGTEETILDQPQAGEAPWSRLHSRMIWVDVVQTIVSLSPAIIVVTVFDADLTWGSMWPALAIAAFGVIGAVADALRWFFTRYRVTDDYVERRTGVFVRQYRSVRRDRIRSVDTEAKLRHRLSGLRVVTIGAGQQSTAGEAALSLDALLKTDAQYLRSVLLHGEAHTQQAAQSAANGEKPPEEVTVFARFKAWWVLYNVFNIWAYAMALGLLWGSFWLVSTFGFDMSAFIGGLLDWDALGWGWTVAIGLASVGVIGVIGLGINYFTTYWNFELARLPGENGTLLRTRHGLFRQREVNRDENRMRGVQISEPVLWRWMGAADTSVITTGLDVWSTDEPTAILPRGPIWVARPVAAAVLGVRPNPLETPLRAHPAAALRRRIWWALLVVSSIVGVLGWFHVNDLVPGWAVWAGLGVAPVALLAALVAYRALGHAVVGRYVVVRSGLLSRATSALDRSSVSTIAVRESLLQRRLGLKTVSAMTAAGWGIYEAPDVAAQEAVAFADAAAPGLLEPFLVASSDEQ
ncbi:PH domain-containing protein [Natronoglycomyces albus]|uniref:PH domain-containing protein n=1 Tax=Natronoglycomyces albus TaxID=2811108 RepID=A0A895XPB1_9ACTN|nr:PH domain-containing protein [Natronoglycomyces albus]QSB04356.1 PH domain-containing protein [Natronoglycomyces albus]